MMNKNEFMNYEVAKVRELIAENFIGDVDVLTVTVVKMNDQKFNGLSVSLDGSNVCPTIYLDDAYEDYATGNSPDVIAERIEKQVVMAYAEAPKFEEESKVPDLTGKPLGLRLLEISRNKEFLRNVPYMEVGNGLALVCEVKIEQHEKRFFATMVNNDILKIMGKTKQEIFKEAISQAWEVDRPQFYSMESKLFMDDDTNLLDTPMDPASPLEPMYVLSNRSTVHGAAALFYPDVQQKIADALGGNYYAIPSSTEEFIIVPESTDINTADLTAILHNANRTAVEAGQVLSDSLLKYDRESGMLHDVTEGRTTC